MFQNNVEGGPNWQHAPSSPGRTNPNNLFLRKISIEAAYLYDAVHLYAQALVKVLQAGEDPYNGTAIIQHIKRSVYKSALG